MRKPNYLDMKYKERQELLRDVAKEIPQKSPKKTVTRELIKAILKDIKAGYVDEKYLTIIFEDAGLEVVEK